MPKKSSKKREECPFFCRELPSCDRCKGHKHISQEPSQEDFEKELFDRVFKQIDLPHEREKARQQALEEAIGVLEGMKKEEITFGLKKWGETLIRAKAHNQALASAIEQIKKLKR